MILSSTICQYSTLIFDCDGVILDSNNVKTEAFYRTALPYGNAPAKAMIEYHVANGGVSRYLKFEYFLTQIVPDQAGPSLDALLKAYAEHVNLGLMNCAIAPGLKALRQKTSNARWLIVSGGDQAELRNLFANRCIADLFDGGIFGSPDTKDQILDRKVSDGTIIKPALFLGDSKYDYEAASRAGLDFVFLSDWSDVKDHRRWCAVNCIKNVKSLKDLAHEAV